MNVRVYEGDGFPIYMATNICEGNKFYLTNGQGCDTIWFKNVAAARRSFKIHGIKTGRDLYDCARCACHYSVLDKKSKKYPSHACSELKELYAKQF